VFEEVPNDIISFTLPSVGTLSPVSEIGLADVGKIVILLTFDVRFNTSLLIRDTLVSVSSRAKQVMWFKRTQMMD